MVLSSGATHHLLRKFSKSSIHCKPSSE